MFRLSNFRVGEEFEDVQSSKILQLDQFYMGDSRVLEVKVEAKEDGMCRRNG